MGFGLLSAAGLQFRLTKKNSVFNGKRWGKNIRPDPGSSCSCSGRWMSVRDPQPSLWCCPSRGRAKAEGKGVFPMPERGKIAKRRQTKPWVCSQQGVTSRVGRRVACPNHCPLCTAQGMIYPHIPTFLLNKAIITPQFAEVIPGPNPTLYHHPGQPPSGPCPGN